MSWTADDAMEQVVDNCMKGYGCKDIAIRWLEKEESHPGCSRKESDEIKIKLDVLRGN